MAKVRGSRFQAGELGAYLCARWDRVCIRFVVTGATRRVALARFHLLPPTTGLHTIKKYIYIYIYNALYIHSEGITADKMREPSRLKWILLFVGKKNLEDTLRYKVMEINLNRRVKVWMENAKIFVSRIFIILSLVRISDSCQTFLKKIDANWIPIFPIEASNKNRNIVFILFYIPSNIFLDRNIDKNLETRECDWNFIPNRFSSKILIRSFSFSMLIQGFIYFSVDIDFHPSVRRGSVNKVS